MCDLVVVTLMKMQPQNSQSSLEKNCDPIKQHIAISLLLGSTPPPPPLLCHLKQK